MPMEQVRPTILYYEATAWEAGYVAANLRQADVRTFPGRLTAQCPPPPDLADAAVASVFVGSRVDRAALERLPGLRLLMVRANRATPAVLAACAARGVAVGVVPHFATEAVAEHTVALLLALSRRLLDPYRPSAACMASGEACGWELAGKTLGVVGLGPIGLRVARLGRAFGMRVLAAEPRPDIPAAEAQGLRLLSPADLRHFRLPVTAEELDRTVAVLPLDALLPRADVISLHLSPLPGRRPLLDAAALARMKPGAILLNTADAALVDLSALRAALDAGSLGGAGLDVWEDEQETGPDAGDGRDGAAQGGDLWRRPNVILSPHAAFNTREARRRLVIASVELLARYLEGQPIPTQTSNGRQLPADD